MHRMCSCTRRSLFSVAAGFAAILSTGTRAAPAEHSEFIAAAFKMRDEAVRAGDQAYGAVVVKARRIVGLGPSRVVLKKDWTAHAEREAIRAAQALLGGTDLSGCLLYSSSRPCLQCEAAAGEAGIARMFFGLEATDAGPPLRQGSGTTRGL